METEIKNINLQSENLVLNTTFVWKGVGNKFDCQNPKIWDSKCQLRIYRAYSTPNIIICSDLDAENTGTSITNSAENLATLIWQKYQQEFLSGNPCFIFIEHYPYHNRQEKEPENFSLVQFNFNKGVFSKPRWSPLTATTVVNLINEQPTH